MTERRLEPEAALAAHHLHVAAVAAHDARRLDCRIELALARIEVQDAARKLVVLHAGLGAQRLQARAAVEAERDELADVVARARGQAFAHERESPQPPPQVPAPAGEQR